MHTVHVMSDYIGKGGRNLNTLYVNGEQVFMTKFVAYYNYLGEITFLNNAHEISTVEACVQDIS